MFHILDSVGGKITFRMPNYVSEKCFVEFTNTLTYMTFRKKLTPALAYYIVDDRYT